MVKNVAEEVMNRMLKMLADRDAEAEKVKELQNAAEADVASCKALVEEARDQMDLCAFQEAKRKEQASRDRVELYAARISKINSGRLVTEAESDSVIDSLTGYEEDLTADYEKAAEKLIDQLRSVTYTYLSRVQETEDTIKRWTQNIYPNYRSATTWKDGSNRMDHPVPVHPGGYRGCSLSAAVDNFLDSYARKHGERQE